MPIEATLLRDAPIEAEACPNCGHEPLELMMRGQVHRRDWAFNLGWPVIKKRPYCAVICYNCKEIIAWEEPTLEDYERYRQRQSPKEEPQVFYVDEEGKIRNAALKRDQPIDASSCAMHHTSTSSAFMDYRHGIPGEDK